jgi:flagellar protein FlgJ
MSESYLSMATVVPPDLLSGLPATVNAGSLGANADRKKIRQAAHDFESVLIQRMMEDMRRTVPESGLLDSGVTDQVQGLFWMYLAQDVSNKGGLGLWRELERQFGRLVGTESQGV